MATPRALALACLLQAGSALFADQGCFVKPEWTVDLAWPETRISVWSSPGHTSRIFELQVHFKNTLKSYDRLIITPQQIKLERTRDIMLQEPLLFDFEASSGEGWREYVFSAREDYALTSVRHKKTISMNTTKDLHPGSVSVKGSNVTLNCQSRVRVWRVTAEPVTVPLDGSGRYSLSVFSNQDISPTFTLDKERIPLSWARPGLVAGNDTGQALPRFLQHNMTLSCSQEGNTKSVCSVKTEASGFQLYLNKYPRFLGVEGRAGDDFFLLLLQDEAQILPCSSHGFAIATYVLVAALVLVILGTGIIACRLVISKKNDRKWKPRDTENAAEERKLLSSDNSVSQEHESERDSGQVIKNSREDFELTQRGDCFQTLVNNTVNKNVHITEALKTYKEYLDEVFALAREGKYQNGVNICLRRPELMGTVRDEEGKSILHYIASCKAGNKAPEWTISDLHEFMKDHNCLPNAVDYKGRTCLHVLADAAETSNDEVSWNGEATTPKEAWLRLARTLMDLGCDPRRTDGAAHRPGGIARMKEKLELANCLEERCREAMPQSQVGDTQASILEAVRKGDFRLLEKKLFLCQSLLPLDAQVDPLAEAVKSGRLRTVMLLLSAGAPLCGLPLVSITPLKAAHMNPCLPVLFPVLMRKEYASRLRYEAHRVPAEPEGADQIRKLIELLADDVESTGDKASWCFAKQSPDGSAEGREARELLCAAAGFGLPLTCQMLASEGVQLHPLPLEPNPVQRAYDKKQIDVLLVLFRDLRMSAFAIIDKMERLSLYIDIEALEFQKLREFCKKTKTNYNILVNQVKEACTGKHRGEVDKNILLCISIHGLVCIFHKIKSYIKDFNIVVDDLTGSTMLHIAAVHNQIHMVECLLSSGADLHAKTKADLTALHLTASLGNRAGMEYLRDCIKSQGIEMETVNTAGISPQQLADGYDKLLEDFRMVLLPEEQALEILSQPYASQKTKSLLLKKFQSMEISDNNSFFSFTKCVISRSTESISDLVAEGENLLMEIGKTDLRFNGKLVPPTRSINALPEDSVQLFWEVDHQVNVFYKEKAGNKYTVCVECNDGKQFIPCFRDEFQRVVRKTLNNHTFSCKDLWLSYPPIEEIDSGMTVFLTWFRNNRTRQVRMSLIPVIKTVHSCLPKPLLPLVNNLLKESVSNYFANYGKNYWKPVLAQLEDHIFSKLSEEIRLVLVACKFITNILYSCWWLPKGYRRTHVCSKHYFGVHLSTLRFRLLISLFLEEVSQTPRKDWESSEFLNRVLSTFKRATCLDDTGRRVPKKSMRLILDSTNADQKYGNNLVCAIVEFLEEISEQKINFDENELR